MSRFINKLIKMRNFKKYNEPKFINKIKSTERCKLALIAFSLGLSMEIYTIHITGDVNKSTGLGWGTALALFML